MKLMNSELWEQAEKFADRSYDITVETDTLSDGQTVYLLRHPELPGCKAQGITLDEAKTNLNDARVDYIYALLECGLEVPVPASYTLITKSDSKSAIWSFDASSDESDEDIMSNQDSQPQSFTHMSLQGDLAEHG